MLTHTGICKYVEIHTHVCICISVCRTFLAGLYVYVCLESISVYLFLHLYDFEISTSIYVCDRSHI